MFMQEVMSGDEEFSRPVESIMRCEDFKSNFARRLSHRYTTRSPVPVPRLESSVKLRPDVKTDSTSNVPERIEPYSQLSKSVVEQNGEAVKPPDKQTFEANIHCTEVTALNMEVETLRWQLAQTEANRQMHIALLKQIVTFLNRVRDHIDNQKPESPRKETMSTRAPRSFNVADLPRSRSVLHVNKNLEYLNPTKKMSTRKISKSISNVNGFRDNTGAWTQSKLSLISEKDSTNKISEEMSRLITLANTVLSTKLPDLACSCNSSIDDGNNKLKENNDKNGSNANDLNASLDLIEENMTNTFIFNTLCGGKDMYDSITNKFIEIKDNAMSDFIVSQSPLTCGLENDFAGVQLNGKERQGPLSVNVTEVTNGKTQKSANDKRNEYNHVSNFIEDESGFSSMSSFQEIGIPIISIIPPSPCKEVGYMEDIPDILEPEKWKTDTLELDKQTMKVFWV